MRKLALVSSMFLVTSLLFPTAAIAVEVNEPVNNINDNTTNAFFITINFIG